jgi:hypothetical protein
MFFEWSKKLLEWLILLADDWVRAQALLLVIQPPYMVENG